MTLSETLSDVAATAGVGALAGLEGTAAMTISSSLEARLRDRGDRAAPASSAGALVGVQPTDDSGKRRFNTVVHWADGTAWGAARGLLDVVGLQKLPAAAAHVGAVWGAEQVLLPATGTSQPAWKWARQDTAADLLHHGVSVAITSLVYEMLDPHRFHRPHGD